MKPIRSLQLCIALSLAVLASPALKAGSLAPACVTDTLANYDASFGPTGSNQCSIGILNFGSFTFSASGTGSPTLLTAADITMTPIFTGLASSLPQGPALELGGAFSVGQGQTATYVINWSFDIDNGPEGDGASAGMDPTGDVTVTQVYCPDGGVVGDCNHPQTTLQDTTIPLHLFDSKSFIIQNFARVRTTIFLDGTEGPSSFENVTSTNSIIDSGTPEPATILLSLGGMLSLAGLRKLVRLS